MPTHLLPEHHNGRSQTEESSLTRAMAGDNRLHAPRSGLRNAIKPFPGLRTHFFSYHMRHLTHLEVLLDSHVNCYCQKMMFWFEA